MIKKINLFVFSVLTLLLSFSIRADQQPDIKAGIAYDLGLGVTALIDNTYGLTIGKDGAAADAPLISGTFEPSNIPLTWYALGGGYVKWGRGIGVRLPIGLNLYFEQDQHSWNAFAQIAPGIRLDDHDNFQVETKLGIGIRYKF